MVGKIIFGFIILLLMFIGNILGAKMEAQRISNKTDLVISDLKKFIMESEDSKPMYRKGVIDSCNMMMKSLNLRFQKGKKDQPFKPMRSKNKK